MTKGRWHSAESKHCLVTRFCHGVRGAGAAAVTRLRQGGPTEPARAVRSSSLLREALKKRRDTQTREKQLTAATMETPRSRSELPFQSASGAPGTDARRAEGLRTRTRARLGTAPQARRWEEKKAAGGGWGMFPYTPSFPRIFLFPTRSARGRPSLTPVQGGRGDSRGPSRKPPQSEERERRRRRGGAGLQAGSPVIGQTGHSAGSDWSVRKAGGGSGGSGVRRPGRVGSGRSRGSAPSCPLSEGPGHSSDRTDSNSPGRDPAPHPSAPGLGQ